MVFTSKELSKGKWKKSWELFVINLNLLGCKANLAQFVGIGLDWLCVLFSRLPQLSCVKDLCQSPSLYCNSLELLK